MNGNGHQTMRVAVPTAELPSQQRSARVDELVRCVAELSAAVRRLQIAEPVNDRLHVSTRAAHEDFVGRSLRDRLRWLLTGR